MDEGVRVQWMRIQHVPVIKLRVVDMFCPGFPFSYLIAFLGCFLVAGASVCVVL